MNDLQLLAINLTSRCNLACEHCYMDAGARKEGAQGELKTSEVFRLLEQIAARSAQTLIVLTGGEQLLVADLELILEHGSKLGLSMVVGTNGALLDRHRAQSLKSAGALALGISLDSLSPEKHDRFRGQPGSWEKTLAAIDHCRQINLPFQLHFSVAEFNLDEIESVVDFAQSTDAWVLNFFFLVCTGRGESLANISAEAYESALHKIAKAQVQSENLLVRARCAPHFKRIVHSEFPQLALSGAEGYDSGACPAGISYCRIKPDGGVTACPYMPNSQGNIRDTDFLELWDREKLFTDLRTPRLEGRCGRCEFRLICGGCRARSLATNGTLFGEDPWCSYQPSGNQLIEPLKQDLQPELRWQPDALQRLEHVPAFLRKMVRRRTEEFARSSGDLEVAANHLNQLASKRFSQMEKARKLPGKPDE